MNPANFGIEEFQLNDPEVTLGMLGVENAGILAQEGYLSVIRSTLSKLMETCYFSDEMEKLAFVQVTDSLEEILPILSVSAGGVFEDAKTCGEIKKETGEIEFKYAINLDALRDPYSGVDPLEFSIGFGNVIDLDGMRFQISIGQVIVAPDGTMTFKKAEADPDAAYYVDDGDGMDAIHPDPMSLFPAFTAEQEAELQTMALKTTEAYMYAYGLDPDILWDKTVGIWWDVKHPGARTMWSEVEDRYNPQIDPRDSDQPD